MLSFKELTKGDLQAIRPYLELNESRFCDYTSGNLYMWRHELWTGFAIFNGTLLIEKEYEKGRYCFFCPLGEDFEGALRELELYCLAKKMPLCFFAVCEGNEKRLEGRYAHGQIITNRSWADYLYNLSDLRDFPGKRYDSKRHNAHSFHNHYPNALFKKATKDDVPRLEGFLQGYLDENRDRDISLTEMNLTKEMLLDPKAINAEIGYYELDGKVIGFSLGERKGDTIYQHIEKALRDYNGIYQALTSDYLKLFGDEALYVNREEDDGNPGLREAKLQLHPVELLRKRFLEVGNQFDLYHDVPTLTGQRVVLSRMEAKDKDDYFALATDRERNQWWGYDYHEDLEKGEEATPSFFYDDIQKDYSSRKCLSFMIHDKEGRFLGEAEMYGFTWLNEAELGVRLTKEAEGKGYAKEALSLLVGFARSLGLEALLLESYLANRKSLLLISSLGFTKTGEGDGKAYFRLRLSAQTR